MVGLASDVALEAADDLAFGLALGGAALGVAAGAVAVAQAADGDHVQGAVGVAVTAVVEAVACRAPGGRWDRAGTAERRERGIAAEALDVLAGGDQQLTGVTGRDPEQLRGARRRGPNEPLELDIEVRDLGVERINAASDRNASLAAWVGRSSSIGFGRSRRQSAALPRIVLR